IAIHRRGSVHNLGEPVPRGFLQVASVFPAPLIPAGESGRQQLGDWLASDSNPLTGRVIVNRVWHWLFGAGLVRTTDNFGTTGELPSHPELLDYLAGELVEHDWSLKWLIREIMLSRTYQLSSQTDEAGLTADPENRLLARMNRRRLDAECLRDTMLFVSSQLRLDLGGPTVSAGTAADYGYQYLEPRRSIYVPALRNALPEMFELFDVADPSVVTGARHASTVAPQALFLLNHPFVSEAASRAAEFLLSRPALTSQARLRLAYQSALGRLPTPGESQVAEQYLPDPAASHAEQVQAWQHLWHALFASLDFRYLE
ncbi:MAG TPA: DUF1553 domain-containing protein, partial [Verrucomicrobiae bacterium]|nr:DUF1553 domain-containing protein [Verrucomicrobiae bacterium]